MNCTGLFGRSTLFCSPHMLLLKMQKRRAEVKIKNVLPPNQSEVTQKHPAMFSQGAVH